MNVQGFNVLLWNLTPDNLEHPITWRAYARPLVEKWYLAGVKISDSNIGEEGGQRMVNQVWTGDRQGSTLCHAPQASLRRPTNYTS